MQSNQSHKSAVQTTYKQTAIGLIPSDWEVKRLGEVCKVNQGLQIPIEERLLEQVENSYKYITIQYLNNGKDVEYILNPTESVKCNEYDVLMTRTGNTGIVISNVAGVFHNNFFKINFNRAKINKNFLIEYLSSNKTQHILLVKAGTSTIPDLNHKDFYSIYFPIPPLPEQQKIATILSTWDVAIDNCKAIIEKLKDRNKGLAQQLLTGKMRVKGFEKMKWSLSPINKIAKEVSSKNNTDKDLVVLSCTKYDGLVPSLEYFGRKIFSDDLTTYKIVTKNCFAYATNHIEEGSIGYQSKFDEALISPMYTVFKTVEIVNDNFLYRVLKSHEYIHQYQKRMEGSIDRRGGLRWDEFSKIKVPLVSMEGQNAIVSILDKATSELNQYQQKLQQLQLQKKGLMQQLLTGKVRVKILKN